MLVLSRKEKDRILFPDLGVAIEFLRLAKNQLRVGIDAPPEVHVLRGELADAEEVKQIAEESRRKRHEIRNRLNAANLALHLIQKQMDAGLHDKAEETLKNTLAEFGELNDLIAKQMKRTSASTEKSDTTKRRALVVEDNAQERELLASFLRLSGYEVDVAQDGVEAMEFLQGHDSPDLILLDMQMPRMSGPETLNAIRGNSAYKDVKVFAVSGSDQKSIKLNWGESDVDHWFSKPINPDSFVNQLNQELEKSTNTE